MGRTLFSDQHYDKNGLNPIFVYLPAKAEGYPLVTDYPKARSVEFLLENRTNQIIKLFWINGEHGHLLVPKRHRNINNVRMQSKKNDGTNEEVSESEQRPFNFGQQRLYVDCEELMRKGFDDTYENLLIFKPGCSAEEYEEVAQGKIRLNQEELRLNGFSLSVHPNGTYLLTF